MWQLNDEIYRIDVEEWQTNQTEKEYLRRIQLNSVEKNEKQ